MSIEAFLSTLLGAFLGVSLPFVIADFRAKHAFGTALDALFAESDAYFQGIRARRNYLIQEADRSWSQFEKSQAGLIASNVLEPTDIVEVLVSQYARFLRPADVFLLRQSQENLTILLRGVRSTTFKSRQDLDSMLGALIEHAARRSWLVWNVVSRADAAFTQAGYNQLIQALDATNAKRLRSVRRFRPTSSPKSDSAVAKAIA
jgi:hypothetical protein